MKQRFSTRTRLVSALLTLAMVFTFLPFSALVAEGGYYVPLNNKCFPDETFRNYLEKFDKDYDGYLSTVEREAVKEIIAWSMEAETLEGIEFFPMLEKLHCQDNKLTSLDVSQTAVTELRANDNQITIKVEESPCTFELSTLPGFDVTKATNWSGKTLKVNAGATQVTYTYDCGKGFSRDFTLNVEVVPDGTVTPPSGGDTPGGGGDGGGVVVIVAAAGVVGYGVYNYVSGHKLQALLPEGVAAPENRAQTALLLWNTAGRPEPADAPAFADVADPDTAKAAQWCVEQGLMKRRLNGKFAPGSSIPAYQVLNAYRKLAG